MSNPVDYIPLRTRFPSGSFDFMLIHIAKVMRYLKINYYSKLIKASTSFEEFSSYSDIMKQLFVCSIDTIYNGYDDVRYEMIVNHEFHSLLYFSSEPIGELEYAQLSVLRVLMRCVRTMDVENFLQIVNYFYSPQSPTIYEIINLDD